jgi:N-acyl-D-aspartate/D-glutamate deacylase
MHSHVAKSANIASKNRLAQICGRAKTQRACGTTTYGQSFQKHTVPKFQNQFVAVCLIITLIITGRAESAPADILLKGGTIIDGTGGKPYQGSVAISDGHIIAVGNDADAATAKQTIDCKNLVVCPGFIDLHNHSDSTILKDNGRSARCYLTQGCTTLVTGNCGSGPTDIGKFYDKLDAKGTGINIATLVPQGSVREKIMGNDLRAPKPDELKKMQDLADDGMQQGAWGISTGLQYIPSAFAKTDELIAISAVVGKRGGFYASHIRDEGDTLLESIEEVIEICKGANLPCHVSHLKANKKPNWGKVRAAAHLIEKAQHDGLKITADQYPYTASSTSIMAMLLPDDEREGGEKATAKRLMNEETAKRLRPIIAKAIAARGPIMIAKIKNKPDWVGKIITDIAKTENSEPVDVALKILRSDPEASGVNFGMDEADVRFVMTLPWVATASDGSSKIDDGTRPHPRSFGTFSRKVGRYSIKENVVPLPAAIRSATGLPADILGITDRGYLRKDTIADIAVIDPREFEDRATYEEPFKPSTGVRWLFLAGKLAIEDGKPLDVFAGKPLRRPPSVKANSVK